jgi:hypothetical protein
MTATNRSIISLLLCALLPAACPNSLRAAATIVVGDGGSISAAIAAASSGDTIEIQSNQFFNETLVWQNKFLTVRAGSGFTPAVNAVGDVRGSIPGAGGEFTGLQINNLHIGSTGTQFTNVTFRQNTFHNQATIGATGNYSTTALLENNHFEAGFLASDTGDATYNITMRNNSAVGYMSFVAGGMPHTILAEQNTVLGQLTVASGQADTVDATLRRNEVHGPMILVVDSFSRNTFSVTNNLITAPPGGSSDPGLDIRSLDTGYQSVTNATLTNNSVIGFDRGLAITNLDRNSIFGRPVFNAQFQNLLLDNTHDISGVLSGEIFNSLISDGTFAGTNGNFGGMPVLTPDYYLQYGSIGIDAGSNGAAIALITDARGNPRIQDGNGDGIARVDVGALETAAVPEPSGFLLQTIAFLLMSRRKTPAVQRAFPSAIALLCAVVAVFVLSPRALPAVLPLGDEQQAWSDLLLPSATGVFDTGTLTIFTNTVPGDLEIGSQFGPSNPGSLYGPSGTLGGTFNASFSISRLHVTPAGAVPDQDSIVGTSYQGGSAGSLGTDYGMGTGRTMFRGIASEVLLDAVGDNTLDILFTITGGDLQELPNTQAPTLGKFAPGNVGLIRIAAPNLPSNWTSNFNFTATSVHIFGLPEPTSLSLLAVALLTMLPRIRRGCSWRQ